MLSLRVRFDGKVLIPQEPVDLPVNEDLRIEIADIPDVRADDMRPGSPAAILRVLREGPHVPPEDVEEMERAIAEGQSPPNYSGVFDDLRETNR